MTDYFGALIQSSGLHVERKTASRQRSTPCDTPSPAGDGIIEVDEQVGVPHVPSSAQRTMRFEPLRGDAHAANLGEAEQSEGGAVSSPSSVERAGLANAAPISAAYPPTSLEFQEVANVAGAGFDGSVSASPPIGEVMRMTAASVSEASVTSSPESSSARGHIAMSEAPLHGDPSGHRIGPDARLSGHALLQAALRWVASGESPVQTVSESAPMVMSARPEPAAVPKDIRTHVRGKDASGNPMIEERLELLAPSLSATSARAHVAGDSETPHNSDQRRRVQAHGASSENVVEVTIDSINVRVDAPAQPVVARTASSTAPRAASESPPRSGLARQTLWRI